MEHLRLWHSQLLRTGELKAALPDATLLIGALDQIVRKVLSTEAQATFRINTFRIRNSIGVRPTTELVHQFYEVLLVEAETMVGSALVEAVEPPAIKLLQNGTPTKTGEERFVPGGALMLGVGMARTVVRSTLSWRTESLDAGIVAPRHIAYSMVSSILPSMPSSQAPRNHPCRGNEESSR